MSRYRKVIAIVGEKEIGKSYQLKKILEAKEERTVILDNSMQPAWLHLGEISLEWMKSQTSGVYRVHDPDYKQFFRILYEDWGIKTKNIGGRAFIEDASAALGMQMDKDIMRMLVGLRHRNVDVTLVFHTIRDTPQYIIPQLNEFIFMRTPDSWDKIADRFPDRVRDKAKEKFEIVQNHPNKHHFEILTIIQTGTKTW